MSLLLPASTIMAAKDRRARAVNTVNGVDPTNTTGYSIAGLDLGTAAADRYIVAILSATAASTNANFSSCSIGGVTATQLVGMGDGTLAQLGIYIAAVPTGATGTLAVNYSATRTSLAYSLFAVYGLLSATAIDTDTDSSAPLSQSVDVRHRGVIFGGAATGDATSWTWAGVDEVYDQITDGQYFTAGFAHVTQAHGSIGITATPAAGTPTNPRFAIVSLR